MISIATLYQLRQHLGFADDDTADDERLISVLEAATRLTEHSTGRSLCPYHATRMHSLTLSDLREIVLDDDLHDLTGLVNGDGSVIPLDDVIVIGGSVLRLINDSTFIYETTPEQAIAVTGLWGWHPAWASAWRDSGDTVQDDPLTANATTLTVTDSDGSDSLLRAPRFQVGHLLRLGDEYLWVLAVDHTTNTLTVERGAQGTIASEHAATTRIDTYQPPAELVNLVLRLATWLYREPDGYTGEDMPRAIWRQLNQMRRVRV